ncbi:MAG: tyrosine-type recombinase/integrase [Eubacteriales bacterium]
MSKRFQMKRFRFKTKDGGELVRHLLTDHYLPMVVPNQYLLQKGVNKAKTGRVYGYKLCQFFNYLEENQEKEWEKATNKSVSLFLDHLIFGDGTACKLQEGNRYSYSTLSSYLSVITDFYRWLDSVYGSEMIFFEGNRKIRSESYLYGQIYNTNYEYILNRTLPKLKGKKEFLKWYTEEEKQLILENFNTIRDKAVFSLTLEGFRIDEVLSMTLNGYQSAVRLIQPNRSKGKQSFLGNEQNHLRTIRISQETVNYLEEYLRTERVNAENESGIISEVIFLNLQGKVKGTPLAYHNFRKILIKSGERAGLSPEKLRTHSGRSTKVMEVLEFNALNPEQAKSDVQIQHLFGWSNINSLDDYRNHNSEIMAYAALLRQKKEENDHD